MLVPHCSIPIKLEWWHNPTALTNSIFLFLPSHKRLQLIYLNPTEAAAQCTLCFCNSPCRQNRDSSFLLTSINAHQARLLKVLSRFLQHVQSLGKLQNSQTCVIIFVTFHLYTDFRFHSSLLLTVTVNFSLCIPCNGDNCSFTFFSLDCYLRDCQYADF